ncbi:MAG: hypothetical protein L3K07_00555 [Thermoplasmata archaeon]|nr:hypothetical protein [Thermoplasmata archaeon]
MEPENAGIALSLLLLCAVLGFLSIRGLVRAAKVRSRHQLMFGSGLGLGTAAVAIEVLAYVGIVNTPMLQAYVFFSAAIVGILSLGSAASLRPGRFEDVYSAFILAGCAIVGFVSFTTPVPVSIVRSGVISGNPPLLLLLLSSLVTVPATVVLLTASVLHLRRHFHARGLMMVAGASILGAGGAFYIASFPVALYYAEFLGILMLFLGLVDLSRFSLRASAPATTAAPSASR